MAAAAAVLGRAGRAVGGRAVRVRPRTWGIVAGVLAVFIAFGLWFRDSSFVDVRKVQITGANGPQARQIREALRTAALDMTTMHFNRRKLDDAVASYPLVTGVSVSTHFPHSVTIEVREDVPVAAIVSGGVRTAATADGRLLHEAPNIGQLPVISVTATPAGGRVTGARPLADLRVLAAAPASLARRVTQVTSTSVHGVVVQFSRGPAAYFGGTDALPDKWAALARVLADPSVAGAAYVDVTVPQHPAAGGVSGAPPPQSDTPQLSGSRSTGASSPGTGTTTPTPNASTTQP
jgi:cell division protein FtsQ